MPKQYTVEELVAMAREQGWEVVHARKHWRLYPTDKAQPPATLAMTPGDVRTVKNIIADLRRRGLDVPR